MLFWYFACFSVLILICFDLYVWFTLFGWFLMWLFVDLCFSCLVCLFSFALFSWFNDFETWCFALRFTYLCWWNFVFGCFVLFDTSLVTVLISCVLGLGDYFEFSYLFYCLIWFCFKFLDFCWVLLLGLRLFVLNLWVATDLCNFSWLL